MLACVRKGDVPRTDPVVLLPSRASFRYSQVCWQYWSVDIEGVFLRWYISWFTPPPHSFDDFWQSVSTRFQPTGGGRWKNLRVQNGLSVEVYVSFYVSLVSAFASIVRLFQPATFSVLSEHALCCSPFLYLAFTCRSTAALTSCLLECDGASTVDTFSSVPGGRVLDGEYDETVAALVHRKCFCVHRLAQTSGTSEQQCCMVTDGSHFRATVLYRDPTTTLTGVAPSCARPRAHRFLPRNMQVIIQVSMLKAL